MLLYRVLRGSHAKNPFDGEGAFRFGGRWSPPGVRLSYTSEHQSLAMLEYFVHLDSEEAPADLVLAVAELPGDIAVERVRIEELPSNWREFPVPPSLSVFGSEFVNRRQRLALVVPSALAPGEYNWLLNPAHLDFEKLKTKGLEPLQYDPRMFHPRRRPRLRPRRKP